MPLDQTRSTAYQVSKSGNDKLFASAQFRKSLPLGLGTGYGLEAGLNNTYRAEVARNFNYSTVTASARLAARAEQPKCGCIRQCGIHGWWCLPLSTPERQFRCGAG